MKISCLLALALLCLSHSSTHVRAHRILGLFAHAARSHFNAFQPLMEALALRGHDVVVVSSFPRTSPLSHYTDIDIRDASPVLTDEIPLDVYGFGEEHFAVLTVAGLTFLGLKNCENILSLPRIQKLAESKFDLVIHEMFNTDCFLGLVQKIGAPHMAMSSSAMMPWHTDRFGIPDNPSYVPNHFLPHSDHMSYFQRMKNVVYQEGAKLFYHYFNYLPSRNISRTYLGESVQCLREVAKNTSLLLLNTHFTMNRPRPYVPAVIEVGGIHIKTPQKLPQNIQKFLDESKEGVIYFSFGSTVRASTFPADKRRALLEAFAELPQRVIWKWDGDLPGKTDNILTDKWLPQPGILNHPNVRLFLTHGGLMGTMEAVAAGVPMAAVPLFGDQPLNVAALVENGVAVKLPFPQLSNKKIILEALKTVLDNPKYAENAKTLAAAFKDRPLPPLDTAIYWTEYVIRQKGAPLLKVASVDLPLYQYLLLDVLAPILGVGILITYLFYLMMKKFLLFLFSFCIKRDKSISDKSSKAGVAKQPKTKQKMK